MRIQTSLRLFRFLRFVFACIVFGVSTVHAADPQLTAIIPYGLQRGVETTVQFSGTRLDDAQALLLYRPGIQVKQLKPAGNNRVDVTLAVATDCPIGLHAVRVRTATGISNLRLLNVGALPIVSEKEPNSDFATPQKIPLGCTVSGVVQNEDVDFFVVDTKKGQRVSVEMVGVRLGNNTFFDPFVAILNPARFELARSDDVPFLRQDCLCAVVAPEDGKLLIQVRESAYGGNGNCKYLVHVGTFPRPTAILPAGGQPGQPLDVTWLGDVTGSWKSTVNLPTGERDEFELFAQDARGISPSPNRIRVSDLSNVLEAEPNNARAQATAAPAPAAFNGTIGQPGDIDYYKFQAKKGQVFDIRVFARKLLRSPLDSVLTITRSNGQGVTSNDDSGGPDSYVRFTAPVDDDYYVIIQDQLLDGAPDFVYRIEVAPVKPALTLALPERIQYVPLTVSVPQNNRMAIMVNAARSNFGGELAISVAGLPSGLSVTDLKMAGNMTSVPMVFTATANAPLGGALADLTGRTTDPRLTVVGHLKQRTMLVRGQNNRDVWGHDSRRMAIAVTQKSPFSIQIVQPKAPIVRRGAMNLKIVATRDKDFKQPIAIYMLYNPPGVGSSRSITIPADKSEATIPLTANASARFGSWPIAVLGRAKVGNGNIEVATPLIPLEIADTFFDLKIEKTAAEQGEQTEVLVRIETKHSFAGKATIQLLGLPAKTTVDPKPIEFTKDTKEVVFPIQVDKTARPGKYQTLVCRAIAQEKGESVVQTLGAGELRIDRPLPPKVAVKKPAAPAVKKAPPKKPVKKRLSRLEQLRLQQQQKKP